MKTQISRPALTPDVCAGRRKKFLKRLPKGSVAIIVTNPERTRSNDTEFPYRASSDMIYLTNFKEPEAVAVFVKGESKGKKKTQSKAKNRFIMFVRPKDIEQEIWTGVRTGAEGAVSQFGANEGYTIDQFDAIMKPLLAEAKQVYYRFDRNEQWDQQFRPLWSKKQKPLINPEEILHEMRLVKSAAEIAIMRHAGAISAASHVEAMRLTKPGMMEYQIQAWMEAIFRFNGASFPAYGGIYGGGKNATCLHYQENSDELKDGDLLLIDAACEYDHFAADITRTFPVNGKFSKAQREIYQIVLDGQKAGIAAAQPGVSLTDLHEAASNTMRAGLVKLGLLPKSHLTAAGEAKAVEAWQKKADNSKKSKKGEESKKSKTVADKGPLTLHDIFMHGIGHWIGMDVHDVGCYGVNGQDTVPKNPASRNRPLVVGNAITVEPGIYIMVSETRVPKKYRGIGVRIEDDLVITKGGNEVVTAGVPKEIAEIEAIMASARASDHEIDGQFASRSLSLISAQAWSQNIIHSP